MVGLCRIQSFQKKKRGEGEGKETMKKIKEIKEIKVLKKFHNCCRRGPSGVLSIM